MKSPLLKNVTEMKVEARIPTEQYGFFHVTVSSLVNGDDDLVQLRDELMSLAQGVNIEYPELKQESKAEEIEIEETPKKKTRKAKVKLVAYDREIEMHKKLFSQFLDDNMKGWKKTHAVKAKEASMQLHGDDFLNEEGELIDSFGEKLLSLMAS